MNKPIFILLVLCWVGCKSTSEVKTVETIVETPVTAVAESTNVKNKEQLLENKGKYATVYGTIIQEDFINKAGRATGVKETLIKLEDGETVHIRNKGSNTYSYDELLNKKVKLNAFIFYGGIDSDNPEHQSRIGYRIDYTEITVLD